MAVKDPKIRQVQLSDGEHDISAKYALINDKDVEIAQLIDVTSDIVKTATLPAANATTWQQYHTSIVLTPKDGGGYDENIIIKGGTSTTPTYEWVDIGDTTIDLSGVAAAGTYWSTNNGAQTATGTATISYDKPKANTDYATSTVKTATGSFTGTTATISASYQPAGSVALSSINAHTHAASQTVLKSALGSATLEADDATTPTFAFNTDAIKSAALTGTKTFVTGVTAASLGGTTSFNTDAIKSASLAADTATTPSYYMVTDAIKSASSTSEFNTDAIKSYPGVFSKLVTTSVAPAVAASTAAITGVGANGTATVVTGYASPTAAALKTTSIYPAANINAVTGVTGTTATLASRVGSTVMNSATVSSAGVLSFNATSISGNVVSGVTTSTASVRGSATTVATGGTTTGTTFLTGLGTASTTTVLTGVKSTGSFTPAVVGTAKTVATGALASDGGGSQVMTGLGTATAASKATVNITTEPATKSGFKITTSAASKGTVTISGGSASGTGTVEITTTLATKAGIKLTTANSTDTASVAGAPTAKTPSASFTGTTATISASYQPAGSVAVSVTMNSHSHSIGTTPTSATGTAAVAVSSHSHQVTVPEL